MRDYIVEVRDISKAFPGVVALSHVSWSLREGEIHGLVGQNGAGKSTFMNILGGVLQPDSGQIMLGGRPTRISSPSFARKLGIGFIHQELALFTNLSVVANLFIDGFPRTWHRTVVDWKSAMNQARGLLERVGLTNLDPRERVGRLRIGERQLVEIARNLKEGVRLLILDEPTSSLGSRETSQLFSTLRNLRGQGVSIIYISHRLDEVFQICDRVTVLRNGENVGTVPIQDVSSEQLIRMMVGQEVDQFYGKESSKIGAPCLVVEELEKPGVFSDISFTIRCGEVAGLVGLMDCGKNELARALFGLTNVSGGRVRVQGARGRIRDPRSAMSQGLGYVPPDRHAEGLVVNRSIVFNVALGNLGSHRTWLRLLNSRSMTHQAGSFVSRMRIATPSPFRLVKYLSGGNQQKVVISRWLARSPRVYILSDPTRGIDVGAKAEIHRLICELAQEGAAVLLLSDEVQEVIALADFIMVMRNGRIIARLDREEFDQARIVSLMTGGSDHEH